MISDVVQAVNAVIVNRHFSAYDVAERLGREVIQYPEDKTVVQTISRSLRLEGGLVRGFKSLGHATDEVRDEVTRLYDGMIDELGHISGGKPIDFRLVDQVGYVTTPRGDFYTLGFVIDFVEAP